MSNPVSWFDIYVADMERATKFYQSVLNIQLNDLTDPSDPNIVIKSFPSDLEKYGATGALVKMEGACVGKNSVLVYFSCEDCSITESKIEASGGNIEKSKSSIGECGFISLAIDTEGNMFGLHSSK